ncbi:MAG: FISUMP domain-containing protein [Bacteroidota bacterium]
MRIIKKLILLASLFVLLSANLFGQNAASLIYQKAVNSVVTIETNEGLGSGFFIQKNLVATNYHVIEDANSAVIYLNNTNTSYEVEGYVALDEQNDLAILKVKYDAGVPLKLSQTMVKQGDDVLVIGSPKGLAATITKGIVSNLNAELKLIQIDAAISHGSSGGPVFNITGEVIGVAVGGIENGQNLNFAIPAKTLENLLLFKSSYAKSLSGNNQYIDGSQSNSTINNTPPTNSKPITSIKQVQIGTQIWMAQNSNVDHFRNGSLIPQARTDEEWLEAGDNHLPAWCYYNNDPAYGEKYGKLYNWYAVMDSRGLCPTGWHVPSDAEWTILENYLGSEAGTKLKASYGWYEGGNGTNSSGFSGLPGGYRYSHLGFFNGVGFFGYWWSSTESSSTSAWGRALGYNDGGANRPNYSKRSGFSVLCLRD